MEYRTPEIPEGINTSNEHPLKEFFILVTGVFGLLVVIMVALGLAAEHLAQYIPFSAEQRIAAVYEKNTEQDKNIPEAEKRIEQYLQSLADQLAEAEELDEGMTIKMHYVNDDTVNAFATLGGNVVMFRGLLEKVPDENTLAMVIAHEIAHVKHRHPIKSLGRAVVIGVALGLLSTNMGENMSAEVLGDAGLLTTLKFSRNQETQSDNTAMQAMAVHYGHVSGADKLFEILSKEKSGARGYVPEFLSTHPLSKNRIENISNRAEQHGWSLTQETKPLPAEFSHWLVASARHAEDKSGH